jgi:hypothetical protein
MGAKLQRVEANTTEPCTLQTRILSGAQRPITSTVSCEQIIISILSCVREITVDCLSGLLGDFELDRVTSLFLPTVARSTAYP